MQWIPNYDEVVLVTFGTVLKEARERKGYDLASAARRLRIRPDILYAIETSDFARMPPRGYARNMVNAYARLVGLNPTEMTRMYLDEVYAYQVGHARNTAKPIHFDTGGPSRPVRSSRQRDSQPERTPRQNSLGRTVYDDKSDYTHHNDSRAGLGKLYAEDRLHPSRHSVLPGNHYTNFYAGPKAPIDLRSKLPFVIAGAVILVLLIIVLALAFGNRGGAANEDVPKVQISGLTDPTQDGNSSTTSGEQTTTPVVIAPTSVDVSYKVASGNEIWVVITTDGTAEQQMITGPIDETVKVTGTWSLSTWVTNAVTITVDGKPASFDATDANGVPTCNVDFAAYLDQWKAAHPESAGTTAGQYGDDWYQYGDDWYQYGDDWYQYGDDWRKYVSNYDNHDGCLDALRAQTEHSCSAVEFLRLTSADCRAWRDRCVLFGDRCEQMRYPVEKRPFGWPR